jgi:hypothetical protein
VLKFNPQTTQKLPEMGGSYLVAGDGLLCSNQARLLAFHASHSQSLPLKAPHCGPFTAAKRGGRGFKSI